jgi:hypothetical protein
MTNLQGVEQLFVLHDVWWTKIYFGIFRHLVPRQKLLWFSEGQKFHHCSQFVMPQKQF